MKKIKIPYAVRCFFGILLLCIALIVAFIPIVPGSWAIAIIGLLFLINPSKVKYLVKIRKSIVYMFGHIRDSKTRAYKINDIKKNFKKIICENKRKTKAFINKVKV